MSRSERYIGLMSGTSLDGVDAALVEFTDCSRPACINTAYMPYPEEVRQELLSLHLSGPDELRRTAEMSIHLAELYARAVAAAMDGIGPATSIRAIGCHGQTVRHAPQNGYTVQLNNPALLAELSEITVVADFRSRDIAAGGQGAPLVPAFHDAIFRSPDRNRCIVNIGGISNITCLARDAPVTGFDCGPGNILMDAWIQKNIGKTYDRNGDWAAQGRVLTKLLDKLLSHDFFATRPPKSCGREQFNLQWLLEHLDGSEKAVDVQATLVELTAISIANAANGCAMSAQELFVCGGGANNAALMRSIDRHLQGVTVGKTDDLGLPVDWVEAVAFAWLARQTLQGLPGNLPDVTGAKGKRILGAIYPA